VRRDPGCRAASIQAEVGSQPNHCPPQQNVGHGSRHFGSESEHDLGADRSNSSGEFATPIQILAAYVQHINRSSAVNP
jgi:hypothetical protein